MARFAHIAVLSGHATKLQRNGDAEEGKRQARIGLWKCNEKECRKQFTVKVGTVFEHGRIPLHKMLQAVYLLCCSKKGCSSHQLHRILGITYKAAWFLSHRIREAMRDGSLTPIGGGGKIVEADETFFVNKKGFPVQSGVGHKMAIVSLVERGGPIRSTVIDAVSRTDVERIIRQNVHRESRLMTDTAGYYRRGQLGPKQHEMVDHSIGEYVRGDVHTNTLEGYYSIFKRGMKASISTAARSTCIATLPSSISDTTTDSALGARMRSARPRRCKASSASGSPIGREINSRAGSPTTPTYFAVSVAVLAADIVGAR